MRRFTISILDSDANHTVDHLSHPTHRSKGRNSRSETNEARVVRILFKHAASHCHSPTRLGPSLKDGEVGRILTNGSTIKNNQAYPYRVEFFDLSRKLGLW